MIINSKWVVNIINAKDVNMKRKVRPNVVSGGTAINLGNNLYYMRGKTHKQGGIDIGSNPKTGIEVENGEVVQTSPTGLRVFSAQPILNGISPANALLMGGNPNNIFNAQEAWKQANHYNDDGTKFKDGGYTPSQEIIDYIKKTEGFRDKWYKDGNGIDTIGYGFTGSRIKKLYPNGITREQADKEFADSIAKRALILAKDTPNWNKLSQNQRDALLSYHYNVGEGSYRNKHKKLQQALADSDWENVVLNMDAGYNDKKNPGLRTRRDYERELFRSGMVASLTGDEEKAFRDWYDRYSRSQNLDPNPDAKEHYYDYRTYWKNRTPEQMNDEWKLGNHLPDTYKMPGHPTFSIESIYSTRKTPGGTWKKVGLGPVYDEQFVDSKYTKRLKKYNNVSFRMGGIGPKNIIGTGGRKIIGKIVKDKYLTDYANKGRMYSYPYDYKHLIEDYILSPYNYKRGSTGTDKDKKLIDDYINGSAQRRALFSKYYNLNDTNFKPDDYIIESKYKPSKSSNENVKYYTYKTDNARDRYNSFLDNNGKFKIDYGEDDNGKYISLYDIWDLAPFGNKTGNQLSGTPIEMYDRIYENDDKQLYYRFKGLEEQRLGKKYGGIHIKPSKRGTFTAAAKRHHMSVQEFARTVLNNRARYSAAMVKKANFARNASKWHKKELGGDMTKQYYITKDNIYSLGGNVRRKAPLGTEEYERFIDADGKMRYRIGNSVYSKDGFSRATGMSHDEIDIYFDGLDNEGRGEITPSIVTATRRPLTSESSIAPSIVTARRPSNNKSFVSESNIEPSVVTAYNRLNPGTRQNTIGFDSSLAGVSYYGPNRDSELPEQQTYNPSTPTSQRARLPINTSGRPTRGLGVTPLRLYDGRPTETPTSGTQSSSTGGQRRNSNRPITSSAPTAPVIPIDYDAINTQINNENNRLLSQSLNNDILTPITGRQLSPITSTNPQGLAGGTSVRTVPNNPYYSRLNVGLHKIGNYIKNNPDLIGLGVNLTGNLAASLINRSAIKGMRYGDAPIPISAQKLPTEVNIEPQVSSIRENVAGQERLIADNTADSRVALARRQRVRNQGAQQYQTLFGNKLNTELQLLTADRLNRQGVDAQNVNNYNQWRRGLYDFENRRREMLAENAVAGINNAAEAIAGERGYLARREARKQDARNRALIALTSPNAQKVFDANPGLYEELIRKMSKYGGNFSLLRKRINK